MNRSLVFFLVGTLVLFITIVAPFLTLLAWLSSESVVLFLFIGMLLSFPVFMSFWYTLNKSHNMWARWLWMQTLGLGTLLMLLMLLASAFIWAFDTVTLGLAVLCIWPVLSLFSLWQALSVKTRKLTLSSHKISKPVKLVQISDVHIGSRSSAFLDKTVRKVNQHDADLVCITGDLLDASSVNTKDLSPLTQLNAPAYMCIGNHERYVDLNKALSAIEQNGVHVLRDTFLTAANLQIIGIDDRDKPDDLPGVLSSMAISDTDYSVLLYHRPDGWAAAIERNIDLTLAGHTHAGQMWPFGLLVKRQYPNMAGYFTQGIAHLYVSVGTGTWGPVFRFGTRSEMTVIEIKPQTP